MLGCLSPLAHSLLIRSSDEVGKVDEEDCLVAEQGLQVLIKLRADVFRELY